MNSPIYHSLDELCLIVSHQYLGQACNWSVVLQIARVALNDAKDAILNWLHSFHIENNFRISSARDAEKCATTIVADPLEA